MPKDGEKMYKSAEIDIILEWDENRMMWIVTDVEEHPIIVGEMVPDDEIDTYFS